MKTCQQRITQHNQANVSLKKWRRQKQSSINWKKFEYFSITSDIDGDISIGDGKYISTNKEKCEERSGSDGNDLEKILIDIDDKMATENSQGNTKHDSIYNHDTKTY